MTRHVGVRTAGPILYASFLCATIATQEPVFDAAVFRLNHSGEESSSIGQRPGGQYVMTNGPQLGLRLEAARALLQALVIDRIERPSQN